MESLAGGIGGDADPERPFLTLLDAQDAEELRRYARLRSFVRGRALFHEGEASAYVLVLTRGRVKVSMTTEDGREAVIGFRGPGHLLGGLATLCRRYGERVGPAAIAITLPITQEELAGWTGSSRESVAKGLHMLRDLGLVDTQRRRIVVSDIDALERM